MERSFAEQTRMSLELRRDLSVKFGEFTTFAAQIAKTLGEQFETFEAAIEAKTGATNAQMEAMRLHLAAAEARLPADGALVKQGFLIIEKERPSQEEYSRH